MAMTRNAGAALSPAGIASLVGDLGGDYVKLLVVSLLLSAFTALTSDVPWYLGDLRGDGGRLGEPRAVPRDGGDVARASLRARSHAGRRRCRAARRARSAGAMAEDARSRLRVRAQQPRAASVSDREGAPRERRRQPRNLSVDVQRHAGVGRPATRGDARGAFRRTALAGRSQDRRSRARATMPQAFAELRAPGRVHGGARRLRTRARPAPPRRRAYRARRSEPARVRPSRRPRSP